MKAWLVNVIGEFCHEVVFAETRGKAKSLALLTDTCEDAHFTEIEVRRLPGADKYYKKGKWHFEWEDPKDRLILVRDFNFICSDEAFEYEDCPNCSARHYCDRYTDVKESE